MVDVLGLAAVGINAIALLFGILALSLNLWQTGTLLGQDIEGGLWEICVGSTCSDIADLNVDNEDAYNAVKAMLFLGIFLLVGSIVCAVLKMFVMKEMEILPLVAGALALVAGLFLMIGFAVYAGEIANDDYDYDAAFALDIVAWILAWVGGGLLIATKFMSKKA